MLVYQLRVRNIARSYSLCASSMAKRTAQKGFIPGYASTIADAECKQRYAEKLNLINGHDPYELPREEWQDNIDMWPAITYVYVCMYLILYPSPYTKDNMLNYKSLDSFQISKIDG